MVIYIKKIGIIIRENTFNDIKYIALKSDLITTLNKFDVEVFCIPLIESLDKIISLINTADGIILPGGDEILNTDYKLVNYLYDNNIPTLGICLGMQTMANNWSSTKEVPVKNHYQKVGYVHKINIIKDTLLYKILEKDETLVNSRHNSGIINTNLLVSATSTDGLIEAVEDNSKKFFLGLEWHPESIEDENSYKIFKYFISIL